jgi:cytochrome c oxidase subunit 2
MLGVRGEQGSDSAHKVDFANDVVTILSVICTVAIVGAMLYFAARYRRQNGVDHETPMIEGNNTLEIIWTVFPTIVVIWVAYLGYDAYMAIRTVPEGAMEVNVTGRKWAWDFQYKNGKQTTGQLVVPVDEPVKLVMTSKDVLHSFFLPVMRTKMDVIPGRYTYQWFRPIKTGDFQVFCTEYCGNEHSRMLARLKVLPRAEFDRWLADDSEAKKLAGLKPSDRGKELYVGKQCITCHSLDGSPKVGPSWLKLFGREAKFADGTTYKADENYLKESILQPQKHIVAGYPAGGMPSYQGQLSDDDIHGIIEFIKTVDGTQKVEVAPAAPAAPAVDAAALANMSPADRGKALYSDPSNLCYTCHSVDGSKIIGPSFKGIWGEKHKMSDGVEVVVDEAYIKESILKPHAKLVEGYGPVMPAMYEGKLTDENIKDITEYIKSLK